MADKRIKDLPAFSGTVPNNAVFAMETNAATQKVDLSALRAAIGPVGSKRITENGEYTAADDNLYGFNEVEVEVQGTGGRVTQGADGKLLLSEDGSIVAEVPLSVSQNGNYTPSSGYAYSEVEVDVSGGSATLTTKTITANGTYNASSDNADGYSQVVANVPNTYSASDEGKVVSNGRLYAQGIGIATENRSYDTTMIKTMLVNVPHSESNIPVAISVTTQPTKASYITGETLDLTGIVVTATYADGTTGAVTGNCTFEPANGSTLNVPGTQTITVTYSVRNTSGDNNYTETMVNWFDISVTRHTSSWTTGTDADVAAMIDAARLGTTDLQSDEGWAIGDVRTIHIDSFTGGNGVVSPAQDMDIVITRFGDYMNCGCLFQFDFLNVLDTEFRMNDTVANTGGYGVMEMKTTTLPALVEALPSWLKTRLVTFDVKSTAGNTSTTMTTVTGNKLALRSEIEVYGKVDGSAAREGYPVPYYQIIENRKKGQQTHPAPASFYHYWLRSPYWEQYSSICIFYASDYYSISKPNWNCYIAPFGCI